MWRQENRMRPNTTAAHLCLTREISKKSQESLLHRHRRLATVLRNGRSRHPVSSAKPCYFQFCLLKHCYVSLNLCCISQKIILRRTLVHIRRDHTQNLIHVSLCLLCLPLSIPFLPPSSLTLLLLAQHTCLRLFTICHYCSISSHKSDNQLRIHLALQEDCCLFPPRLF